MLQETAHIGVVCPGRRDATHQETFARDLASGLHKLMPGWAFDIFSRSRSAEVGPGVRKLRVAELVPRMLAGHYDLFLSFADRSTDRLLRLKRRRDGTPIVHIGVTLPASREIVPLGHRPNAIVADSPYTERLMRRKYPGAKVVCIPRTVDRDVFHPLSAEEIRSVGQGQGILSLKRPIVLCAGTPGTGVRPELLNAAVSRIPNASLVIIGGGQRDIESSLAGIEELVGRFIYVPRVSREQMAIYYNACDIFTLPAVGTPDTAFLEAMACNKPVLAQCTSPNRWLVGDAGLVCDCMNPDEYADSIRLMLAIDFRDRPLARSRVFDWSQVADLYAGLFAQLMSRGEESLDACRGIGHHRRLQRGRVHS